MFLNFIGLRIKYILIYTNHFKEESFLVSMAKIVQIKAYEASDGRNYVGVQKTMDMTNQKASVKYGCVIRTENLQKGTSYDEGIRQAYASSPKVDILNFGLEKVVKMHSLTVTLG